MKKPPAFLVALLILTITGCLDSDEEFTLNPDGSGKVKIKAVSVARMFEIGPKLTPEDSLKTAVIDTLKKSQGVDCWADVAATVREDGKTAFSATAYFKDISKVKLNILGNESDFPHFTVKKEADGSFSVEATPRKAEGEEAAAPAEKIPEEDLKQVLKAERLKLQGLRRIMEGFLKDLRLKTRVVLPGAVADAKNFKRVSENVVEVTVEGKTVLTAMEELVADDAFLRKQLEGGRSLTKSGPPVDEVVMQKLFGEKAPLRAVVRGPVKDAFDYEAEAGAARKDQPEVFRKFGVPAPSAPAIAGEGFKSLKILGVKLIHAANDERGVRPFSESVPGISFCMVGEFSGAVLSLKEGVVTRAVSSSGDDLLPKDEFDRKINYPQLTNDHTAVVFEVRLALPGAKAAGIKELSGKLEYVIGKNSKEVDLGLNGLAKGSEGKALAAKVAEIEESTFMPGHQVLTLKLDVERDAIESVVFFDGNGKEIETMIGSDTSAGTDSTLYYTIKGKIPAKGRAVAKIYQDVKVYQVPFKISDVDLFGRPLK